MVRAGGSPDTDCLPTFLASSTATIYRSLTIAYCEVRPINRYFVGQAMLAHSYSTEFIWELTISDAYSYIGAIQPGGQAFPISSFLLLFEE